MASESSPLTKAPMTPKLVTLKFSKGLDFVDVFKNGYRNKGICAFKKNYFVSECKANAWSNPKTEQTFVDDF